MCGIAGYIDSAISTPKEELWATGTAMALSISHRGPDDSGLWIDEKAGIVLAHRRLSILDLTAAGRQPMHSQCGRYVLVFNGEIYNFRAIREDLTSSGCCFNGSSDTEVMLEAISRWGLRQAISRFNGMFAFALWDRNKRRLFLARDRFGEKPLYYGWFRHTFVFGSELKALRQSPEFSGDLDRQALAAFLRLDYIPAPLSIYKSVSKVPAASIIEINPDLPGSVTLIERYWSATESLRDGQAHPYSGTPEESVEELDALLRDAVRLRMESDVPLGAFLSGGIDSSTVVALMQQQSGVPVKTFTVDFVDQASEATPAVRIAEHLGTDHHVLQVTSQDALNVIPKLPSIYDEPFSDTSQIPTCLISEFARRHVTVSLSGDGGDELFCGYTRYVWAHTLDQFASWVPRSVRDHLGSILKRSAHHRTLDGLVTSIAKWIPASTRPHNPSRLIQRAADILSVTNADDLHFAFVSRWANAAEVMEDDAMDFSLPASWPPFSLARSLMLIDAVTYLPDDLLVKLDRASMTVGLEARVPLLDHRVYKFACRLPISPGMTGKGAKLPLRSLLARYVPKELFERPKCGFGAPIGEWLRGPLRPWAEELLSHSALCSSSLKPDPIRRKWQDLLKGAGHWEHHIWSVLVFVAWLKSCQREESTRNLVGREAEQWI